MVKFKVRISLFLLLFISLFSNTFAMSRLGVLNIFQQGIKKIIPYKYTICAGIGLTGAGIIGYLLYNKFYQSIMLKHITYTLNLNMPYEYGNGYFYTKSTDLFKGKREEITLQKYISECDYINVVLKKQHELDEIDWTFRNQFYGRYIDNDKEPSDDFHLHYLTGLTHWSKVLIGT